MSDSNYNYILITGTAGKLGKAVLALIPGAIGATRNDFDLSKQTEIETYLNKHPNITTILHCAAMISPPKINEDIAQAIGSNIIGTSLLSAACYKRNIRLVYISTDYVFSGEKGMYKEGDELLPPNKYAWSKLGGECAVQMLDKWAIIRLSFGPDEFPYKAAFTDQFTSREPASIIAEKIKNIVFSDFNGIIHIGGKRKSVYDYALSLGAQNIDQISIKNMSVKMPTDTSLDCSLYDSMFNK
jgi:dTDP-4-dehydrorhamnose reductase